MHREVPLRYGGSVRQGAHRAARYEDVRPRGATRGVASDMLPAVDRPSRKPPASMRRARFTRRARFVLGVGAAGFLLYRLIAPLL